MFSTNQNKRTGRGVPSICLFIPAKVTASLAEELITEVQKNPALFDNSHPVYKNAVMHTSTLFTFLDSQEIKGRLVK